MIKAMIPKIGEGSPHVGDLMEAGTIDLIINTPSGWGPRKDGDYIRTSAVRFGVPSITTLAGLQAVSARSAPVLRAPQSRTKVPL